MEERVKRAMLLMTRQCWEAGIAAQALLERGDESDLEIMVRDIVTRQSLDGRLCNVENTKAVTDSSFCIPAVWHVAQQANHETEKRAVERNIQFLLYESPRREDGVLYHMLGTQEIWADSAAFLPYSLALSGYCQEGIRQMKGLMHTLRDTKTGLFFHVWDEERGLFSRKYLWGIGNGWFLTGIYRLIQEIPRENKMRQEFVTIWRMLLEKVLMFLDANALFHNHLSDSASFLESECSEMIAYMIFCGVQDGFLDSKYAEIGEKIRYAVRKRVDMWGMVTGCAGSPHFVAPGISVEGQAHFLMMEAAYRRMV